MNKKPAKLPYVEFKSIYSKVPRLCLDLIIENEEGILLSLRDINPGKGLWHLPGGTILMGETIQDVIQRVAFEETGLRVSDPKLTGIIEFPESTNLFYHSISIAFHVRPDSGILKGSYQGQKLQYFKLLPENMINEHKQFILVNQGDS